MRLTTLQTISRADVRDNFIINNIAQYTFLSSWAWGELHRADGHEVLRYGIYSATGNGDNTLIGVMLLIKHKAKRGTYLLCPHGPLIMSGYDFFEVMKSISLALKVIIKHQGASFARFSPLLENTIQHKTSLKTALPYRRFAPIHAHAEETNILDLAPDAESLMKNLRKTTRYMINRAKKEGVIVTRSKTEKDITDLVDMHRTHSQRSDGKLQYTAFSEHFIRNLLAFFGDDCQIFRGEYQGYTEAMVMTIRFGSMTAYYIGASDRHSKFSPAYITQWEAIMYAKSIGCTSYNFWGVPPDDNPKHPLAGVGLFKRGFGGEDVFFVHAHDMVVSLPRYALTRCIETYRAYKRGYYYERD